MTKPSRQQDLDTIAWCAHAADPALRPHCVVNASIRFGTIALCGPCASRRSTAGKGQPGIPLTPSPTIDLLSWIHAADQQTSAAERTLLAAVTRARQAGLSWTSIGTQLGVSRQAAQQRFRRTARKPSSKPDPPRA
jgi:hypothetical protein